MRAQAIREIEKVGVAKPLHGGSDSDSTNNTCSARDLDEYLVDINDGMDIDDYMGHGVDLEVDQGEGIRTEAVVGCSQDVLDMVVETDSNGLQKEKDVSRREEWGQVGMLLRNKQGAQETRTKKDRVGMGKHGQKAHSILAKPP